MKPLRTIIAGSRTITSLATVSAAIESCGWPIFEVVSGAARGVDKLGEQWAALNHVPVRRFPADWDGPARKQAGRLRNMAMAQYAEALIAVWDGHSPGTRHMIEQGLYCGLAVYVPSRSLLP